VPAALRFFLGHLCFDGLQEDPLESDDRSDEQDRLMSLPLVFLTALFTGMCLRCNQLISCVFFSAEQFTSDLISVSFAANRPVLTSMWWGAWGLDRRGARDHEGHRADRCLKALATNTVQYLVVPRFIAALFMLFILTIYADVIGMFGGYLIAVFKLA